MYLIRSTIAHLYQNINFDAVLLWSSDKFLLTLSVFPSLLFRMLHNVAFLKAQPTYRQLRARRALLEIKDHGCSVENQKGAIAIDFLQW